MEKIYLGGLSYWSLLHGEDKSEKGKEGER